MNTSLQKKKSGTKTNRFKPAQYLQFTCYNKGRSFHIQRKSIKQTKDDMGKTQTFKKINDKHTKLALTFNVLKKEEVHTKKRKLSGSKKPLSRIEHSPYMSNSIEIQKLLRLLVPVKGPTDSLKLQIKKYNEMNMKNAQMHIVKKSEVFVDRMKAYALRMGLPQTSKIFMMNSRDKHIKDELMKRGWIESNQRESILFHLKWVYKDIPTEYNLLQQGQIYNHFKNNQELTNKSYLQKNIKKVHHQSRPSFPYSFDLELNDDSVIFHQLYNKIQAFSFLKKLTSYLEAYRQNLYKDFIKNRYYNENLNLRRDNAKQKSKSKPSEKLINNLLYKDHDKIEKITLSYLNNFFQVISAIASHLYTERHIRYSIFQIHSEIKFQLKVMRNLQQEIMNNSENIFKNLSDFYVIELFKMWKRVQESNLCYGYDNMWIMKPAGVSRGSGIIITNDLTKINQMRHGKIIQKYIEHPLLLDCKRKFDIRQWILVKSFTPFKVYAYQRCYARFSSVKYSNDKYENMQKHLTNYSQNKESYIKRKILRENMSSDELINSSVLSEEQLSKRIGEKWLKIKQKMFYDIIKTLNCCKGQILQKESCFQLFGFDIIIDEQYQPYILEVNMSPACENRSFLGVYLEEMANGVVDMIQGNEPAGWNLLRQQQYETKFKTELKINSVIEKILKIQAWWRKIKKAA